MAGLEGFLSRLRSCGYDGPVNRRELEELFQDEELGSFLHLVHDLLTPDHVLDVVELKQFNALKKAEGALFGDALSRKASEETEKAGRLLSSPNVENEIGCVSERLVEAKKRVGLLEAEKNMMSQELATLKHRTGNLELVVEKAGSKCRDAIGQAQISDETINKDLDNLEVSSRSLVNAHQKPLSSPQSQPGSLFLFHQDFSRFHELEEQYMKVVTAYTKAQFFQGFSQVAGHTDGSRYQLLDIQDPELLILKGEAETVKAGYSQELSRLKTIYPVSQSQKIDALAVEVQTKAAYLYLQTVQNPVKEGLDEAQQKLADLKEEANAMREEELPALLSELASLQATPVLHGDYELKLARQNYFSSKQDQVIHFLLKQRARHEFVCMVLEYEGRQLRDSHRLLSATQAHLSSTIAKNEARQMAMCDLNYKAPDLSRATLDGRDSLMNCLYAMLDRQSSSSDSRLFKTYEKMLDNVKSLRGEFGGIKSSLRAANIERHIQTAQLEKCLTNCRKLAFPKTAKIPKSTFNNLARLSEVLLSLEKALKEILQGIEEKRKLVRSDPLLMAERRLWILFYTDAAQLKHTVADLGARLQASQDK